MTILQRIKRKNSNQGRENRDNGMAFEILLCKKYRRRSDVLLVMHSAGSRGLIDIMVQFKWGIQYWISCKTSGVWVGKELAQLRKLKSKLPGHIELKLAYYISPKKYRVSNLKSLEDVISECKMGSCQIKRRNS